MTNIEITQNVKFIKHNYVKSTNAIISFLEYTLSNQIDMVLFLEPGKRDEKTISHPSFTFILLKIAIYRTRVAIFVPNSNPKLQCTHETDHIDDSIFKFLKIQLMKFEKCRFSIFITKKVKVIKKHTRIIDF